MAVRVAKSLTEWLSTLALRTRRSQKKIPASG